MPSRGASNPSSSSTRRQTRSSANRNQQLVTVNETSVIPPPRRSLRLEAARNRDRETEENALRQIRESVAHTHRYVQTARMSTGSSRAAMYPPVRSRVQLGIRSSNSRNPLVRQNALRRRDLTGQNSNRQDDQQPTAARISNGAARMRIFTSFPQPRDRSPGLVFYERGNAHMRERLLDIGLFLGAHNRYSSDSEDSFFQPRVIDPEAISEDESDDDLTEVRELSPPHVPATPEPVHRPVTRSMSRQPNFYDQPSSSATLPRPRPVIRKKTAKSAVCKLNGKVGAASNVKKIIKVEKVTPCSICFEDEPKKPVACVHCRQSIGCRYCVKKWFYTTNMSHLDQRTPYPIGSTDRNHKRCPLCRADWGDAMEVVAAVEKDTLQDQPISLI